MCQWCWCMNLSRPSRRRFLASIGASAAAVALAGPAAFSASAVAQDVKDPPTRSITISTKEVTDPDVAVSPDGRWLVFTALGHLFQLPTTGGAAKQLTFGPYYDSAPAISPDGTSVAFISDRETLSQGNVSVLDIASGRIRRLTNEFWADRPAWSPDGKSIAFLSYELLGPTGDYWFVVPKGLRSQVRQVGVADGKVAVLSEPGFARAVAFLTDGRPVWSEVELESEKEPAISRLAVATQAGQPTTALMVEGVADRIGVDPGGLYLRLYEAASPMKNLFPQRERLAYLPLGRRSADQTVTGLLSGPERSAQGVEDRGEGARVYPAQLSNPLPRPAFGVANGSIYLGDRGKLWRVDAATGKRDEIAFSAEITFDFLPGSPPPAYANRNPASPTSILTPRLAPDGASVIFTAAGYLWRQPLAGGETRRLLDTGGFEWGPAALSPDGKKLAYQLSEGADQQLRVVDLATGRNQVLISEPRTGRYQPAWSPDGTRLVYAYYEHRAIGQKVPCVYLADLANGKHRKLADGNPHWTPSPHFSGDGKWVYFTADGQVHRYPIETPGTGQPITEFTEFAADAQVSPDGKRLAFRRNDEIWMAPLGAHRIRQDETFRLSPRGGHNFAFTPDGTSLVYSSGADVWLHPLKDGGQKQVPIQLKFSTEPPPPVLLRNVRVLDFKVGGFTEGTSLLVEDGRIQWIGSEAGHTLPGNLNVVDGGGRFAIPGLFDVHTHTATPIHPQSARDVSHMELWIAYGVTSVGDMGSDLSTLNAWADRRTGFAAPVPRVFSYGSMIEAMPFIFGGSAFIASDEQAREVARVEKGEGAVGLKSYFTLQWSLHHAIARAAVQQGLPVRAHAFAREEAIRGVLLGHEGVEHMLSVNMYYDDILKLFAAAGTRWTPTLPVMFAFIPEAAPVRTAMIDTVKRAYRNGVQLLPGTDSLNLRDEYGQAVHAELQNFAQAGIPPLEVLRIATQHSAAMVGADKLLGSLEPGKLADIVLLEGNPLDNIANTLTVWRVLLGGRVFEEPQPLTANGGEDVSTSDDPHSGH
jgi:Tol biopolymer transport system component